MRKSKEIKRKRALAGIEYKRGNRPQGYKLWAEAKKELDELRAQRKHAAEAPAEAPPEASS